MTLTFACCYIKKDGLCSQLDLVKWRDGVPAPNLKDVLYISFSRLLQGKVGTVT